MAHHDDARFSEVLAEIVGDADTKAVFRRLPEQALQELIETELTATIGAAPHERTESRTNHRNGGRPKTLSTPGLTAVMIVSHLEISGEWLSRQAPFPLLGSSRVSYGW